MVLLVHPQESKLQCHQADTEVDPRGKEKSRPSKEQLEKNRRRRGEQSRLYLEAA